jgi:hypothetical protein
MRKTKIPVTVTFKEAERPFDDMDIRRRMREQVERPSACRLLSVSISTKGKDGPSGDFTFTGEAVFGRWFPFQLTEKSA